MRDSTVCAVVVTYNRKLLLAGCIDSLLGQTRAPDRITVINNASTDGTAEMLRELYPKVELVNMPSNTGGAGGFHEGVRRAYESGCDWLWLMDDDLFWHANALAALLDADRRIRESDEPPGQVLVPVRLWPDGSIAETAGLEFNMSNPFVLPDCFKVMVMSRYRTYDELPDHLELEDFAMEGPLVPRGAVKEVGLPSKEFFILCDDTDYAMRLRKAGYSLRLVKGSRGCRMAGRAPKGYDWKTRFSVRNLIWLMRLHGTNWPTRCIRPWLWAIRYALVAALKLPLVCNPSGCRSVWSGAFEGVLGRLPTVVPIETMRGRETPGAGAARRIIQ